MVLFNLTIVRHGESTANVDGIIQGQSEYPLTKQGRDQAIILGRYFKNQIFNEVICSDLGRAKETCDLILKNGHPSTKNFCPVYDARLREKSFGTHEGKSLEKIQQLAAETGVNVRKLVGEIGESHEEVYLRVIDWFNDLCVNLMQKSTPESPSFGSGQFSELSRKASTISCTSDDANFPEPDANVLVVAHGGPICEFFRYLANVWNCQFPCAKAAAFRQMPNTGHSQFVCTYDGDGTRTICCLYTHSLEHLKLKNENFLN